MIIETKTLGSRVRPFEPWEVQFSGATSETLPLKAFLTRIVLQEVEAFKLRQEERKLERVLSPAQLSEAAARGKVDMGGRDLTQALDPGAAVETALLAFEDGIFYVFVDEVQIETLATPITLYPYSHVLILRLVPLVGG